MAKLHKPIQVRLDPAADEWVPAQGRDDEHVCGNDAIDSEYEN